MKNLNFISKIDMQLFRKKISGTKPLLQDKIKPYFIKNKKKIKISFKEKKLKKFYFSDIFEPIIHYKKGFMLNSKLNINYKYLKKIIHKNYKYKLFIDLHGKSKLEAKKKLENLISKCIKKKICCICIIHGNGQQILKKKIPYWLVQHPNFLGLYKSHKIFGGNGSLLLIIKVK
ncbi:endonuclease SmrB [Sodalis-like secondary symbiont of Drepanosiphum platanoidis]|uniref:endonuclease SmrB n=1 Tax=Sodalis-like secondary symbiont of Drepanosiphum platanoidis TaxID=2994493 RepID=UPI0034645588